MFFMKKRFAFSIKDSYNVFVGFVYATTKNEATRILESHKGNWLVKHSRQRHSINGVGLRVFGYGLPIGRMYKGKLVLLR